MHLHVPADVARRCDDLLTRPRGPALLALVILGRVTTAQVEHVRHLSADLDALYDDAEATALATHAATVALMRDDLALAQLRQRRRRSAA